ncbi:MAG: hypothetical protein KJ053_14450 [Dehalococcoidia bacterium]|nr:hypothetical protein [Dehalococcoidia bacterium]
MTRRDAGDVRRNRLFLPAPRAAHRGCLFALAACRLTAKTPEDYVKRLGISILVAGLFALAGIATTTASSPHSEIATELRPSACGNGQVVVNAVASIVNNADSGVGGNYWAYDTLLRHYMVWKTGPNEYCAIIRDSGWFKTVAGASPGNTGTIAAGVRGLIRGGYRTTTFTGTWSPQWPTFGYIGKLDYQCDLNGNCPGAPVWRDKYFTGIAGFDLDWWGWFYHAGPRGTWYNAESGNVGDIKN